MQQTLRSSSISSILVVRLSAIGDCVHALPVIAALREEWPQARIGWAIQETGKRVVESLADVDRFHLFPRRERGFARLGALLRFAGEMRRARYTVAIDLQGNTKSAMVARASGAKEIYGLALAQRKELNRWLVPSPRQGVAAEGAGGSHRRHVIECNLEVLRQLGMEPQTARQPALLGASIDQGAAAEPIEGEAPLDVVLCPGTTWPTKIWPLQHFAELAARLLASSRGVTVFWGNEQERRWAQQICERVRSQGVDGACVAPPLQLQQLPHFMTRARLVIGNDSGPLHLAAALGVPAVAVYGATDPVRNGLFWPQTRSVVVAEESDVSCRPCWRRTCARGDLACLERLSVDRVLRACHDLEAAS